MGKFFDSADFFGQSTSLNLFFQRIEVSRSRYFRGIGILVDPSLIIKLSWEEYNTTENNGEEDAKPYLLLWRLR